MAITTFEYLEEPKLQFGQYFEHEDTKTGLAEYGPFGLSVPGLHPSEIKLGFIGTRETIEKARDWITECSAAIESHNVQAQSKRSDIKGEMLFSEEIERDQPIMRLNKMLNRDFIGFNQSSSFRSSFQTNPRWEQDINPRELDKILRIEPKSSRILQLVDFFESYIKSLATTSPTPTIIILALTPEIEELADAVQISGNYYLNFRRAIKGKAMCWGVPIQLLRYRTAVGTDKSLQEKSLRAWNFCTAQYYKADGVPWKVAAIEPNTCFIGVSFYVAKDLQDNVTMRSSVAQAFDHLGQSLVLRGDPFSWDERTQGKSPHLTKFAASTLIQDTLMAYKRVKRLPPRRVVIYKTSEFWGEEHREYNEKEGFYEGIEAVFDDCVVDLVALRKTGIRLLRNGKYPPLRGTYFSLEGKQHFLYTNGFTPYLNTYPGSYVPDPWFLAAHHGSSSPKDLFREILALTKMNVNNCGFADGTPITLSFSQKIGEIMKHISEEGIVRPEYKFYM